MLRVLLKEREGGKVDFYRVASNVDFGVSQMTREATAHYDLMSTGCFTEMISSKPLNNLMCQAVCHHSHFIDKETKIKNFQQTSATPHR